MRLTGKDRIRKYALGGLVDDNDIDPDKPSKASAFPSPADIKKKYSNNPYVNNGRETWGAYLNDKLPYSQAPSVKDAVYNVAKTSGVNPGLLYSSAMEEGLQLYKTKKDQVSQSYDDWSRKNTKSAKDYPVDGFYNYGLDTFGDRYNDLVRKGYLPKDFNTSFTPFQAINEKSQKVNSAAFKTDDAALMAKSAMLKDAQDQLNDYVGSKKVKLSDKGKDFFTLAAYNMGIGKAKKMIDSYNDKGYLKDDKYLDPSFTPASYAGVYTNVQRRLQNKQVLENEGFMKDYNPQTQQTQQNTQPVDAAAQTTTPKFAAGTDAGGVKGSPDWTSLLSQAPGIANSIASTIQNNPADFSKQPIVNASTVRNMINPYAAYAFGGEVDEDTMSTLQSMADQAGISVEELISKLQQDGSLDTTDDDNIPDDADADTDTSTEPDNSESNSDSDAFAYGGKVGKKNRLAQYATGGQVGGSTATPKIPVNVEGNEVLETPDGQVAKVKGPKHESGGVNMAVPKGTKIYSDRLKVDGKTMQQRKLSRERAMNRLTKLAAKNPSDNLLQSTIKRTAQQHEMEEQRDMAVQKAFAPMNKKFAAGTGPDGVGDGNPLTDYLNTLQGGNAGSIPYNIPFEGGVTPPTRSVEAGYTPSVTPTLPFNQKSGVTVPGPIPEDNTEEDHSRDMTTGDYVGMAGNILNGIAPIVNTIRNKQATTPNVNRFLGFGRDALKDNDTAEQIAAEQRTNSNVDADIAANTAYARNRNSAGSVNTVRALDALTTMGTDRAKAGANANYANLMGGILSQRSTIDLHKDTAEMGAEERRDVANKQDTDNYYSNMASNLTNLGTNVEGLGRNLNQSQANKDNIDLVGLMSKNGIKIGRDKSGRLKLMNIDNG